MATSATLLHYSNPMSTRSDPTERNRWLILAVEIGIAICILAAGAVWLGLHGPRRAAHEIAGFGNTPTARVIFTAVYAATLAVGLPSGSLSIVGGSAFGFLTGCILDYVAIALGAAVGYWLARRVGEPATRNLLRGRHSWLDRVRRGDKFGTLLALQISPLVPNGMLNLAAGLANAIPTIAYSYLGHTLLHTGAASHTPLAWIVRGVGIAVTLAVIVPPIYVAVRRRKSNAKPSPNLPTLWPTAAAPDANNRQTAERQPQPVDSH
jgi:uncharacterized membrane protein YdjX (TVP38/TMEM64 family)